MDEEQRGKAERIKALLAGYYGSGGSGNEPGAPGSEGGANAGSNASDGARAPLGELANAPPATLDSPAFNAEQHISHILKSYPLEKLMIEHRNMAREIKNLDSGNVAVKSSSLSDKLQARGEDMEELQKVQLLLRKLQTVFDLPKKKVQLLLKELQTVFDLLKKTCQDPCHGPPRPAKKVAIRHGVVVTNVSTLPRPARTSCQDLPKKTAKTCKTCQDLPKK
eukprot:gene22617-29760_t